MIRLETSLSHNPNFSDQYARAIMSDLTRMAGEAEKVAKAEAPKNIGHLVNSIHLYREKETAHFEAGIETNLPYALVMELGRRAGSRFPPLAAIARWVWLKREHFEVREYSTQAGGSVSLSARPIRTEADARRVAWGVARGIARKGIRAREFFQKAAEVVERQFSTRLNELGVSIRRAWEA